MLINKIEVELEMLERHLLILKFVIREEPIGIMKLAETTGLPKHKVRYSLRVLETRA
jgi:predicted transcriptional regulator